MVLVAAYLLVCSSAQKVIISHLMTDGVDPILRKQCFDFAHNLEGAYHLGDCGNADIFVITKFLGVCKYPWDAHTWSQEQEVLVRLTKVGLHVPQS